jgi:hypothetical protein
VIYYLRHDLVSEAFDLVKDLEPSTPQEYILKGVVHATLGEYNTHICIYIYVYMCIWLVTHSMVSRRRPVHVLSGAHEGSSAVLPASR